MYSVLAHSVIGAFLWKKKPDERQEQRGGGEGDAAADNVGIY